MAKLNARLKEHGVGYCYSSGEIIRIDSQLVHHEAVVPALRFLAADEFSGPNEEFLRAHEHYRHGRHGEALNDALKALESLLKAICEKRGWSYPSNATAKTLLGVVLNQGLVPPFLQTHFASLRQGLESGVPTIRNKLGGHGQGAETREVLGHVVAYHLHLTASAILFLAECDESLG